MSKSDWLALFILIASVITLVASCWVAYSSAQNTRHEYEQKAYLNGYYIGKSHQPLEACPFVDNYLIEAWKRGWLEGQVK